MARGQRLPPAAGRRPAVPPARMAFRARQGQGIPVRPCRCPPMYTGPSALLQSACAALPHRQAPPCSCRPPDDQEPDARLPGRLPLFPKTSRPAPVFGHQGLNGKLADQRHIELGGKRPLHGDDVAPGKAQGRRPLSTAWHQWAASGGRAGWRNPATWVKTSSSLLPVVSSPLPGSSSRARAAALGIGHIQAPFGRRAHGPQQPQVGRAGLAAGPADVLRSRRWRRGGWRPPPGQSPPGPAALPSAASVQPARLHMEAGARGGQQLPAVFRGHAHRHIPAQAGQFLGQLPPLGGPAE